MTGQIHIRLHDSDGDPDRLEQAAAVLRSELLELDVEDVVPVRGGGVPPGARAADLAEIGSLLVTAAQLPATLRQLVDAVRGWLGRDPGRFTAELVIGGDRLTVTGIDAETQQRLVDAWLRAHALDRPAED